MSEVVLACRELEAPISNLIEAEYNRRVKALEQRLDLLERKVSTHANFDATKIVQAAAQGYQIRRELRAKSSAARVITATIRGWRWSV